MCGVRIYMRNIYAFSCGGLAPFNFSEQTTFEPEAT
jgi:hypothetical protein